MTLPSPLGGANLQEKDNTIMGEDAPQSHLTPTTTQSSHQTSSKSAGSAGISRSARSQKSARRIQLLVSTGSNKIAISGEIDPVEQIHFPHQADLSLQDTVENTFTDQVEAFTLFEVGEENEDGADSEHDDFKV